MFLVIQVTITADLPWEFTECQAWCSARASPCLTLSTTLWHWLYYCCRPTFTHVLPELLSGPQTHIWVWRWTRWSDFNISLIPNCCNNCLSQKMRSFSGSQTIKWLRLQASTAGGLGSIAGQGTKTQHAVQHSQINILNKLKKKKSKQGELPPTPSKRLLLADKAFILGNFLYQQYVHGLSLFLQ